MISPALMVPWLFGRKRKPMPEYQSPNAWSEWMTTNNLVLAMQEELINTFDQRQMNLYLKYRNVVLEAERKKPWQGDYAKLNPTLHPKEKGQA